jgi:antitoxin VapB
MGVVDSSTFKNGDTVAVRLPKEVAFAPDIRVTIERQGDVLTIRPVDEAAEQRARVLRLAEQLRALGPIEVERREDFDGPERPGLL